MQYTYCHHCGNKLVVGAMRCISCGKILKSPEEQIDSIERVKGKGKKINLWPVIKLVLFVVIAAFVYNKFSDRILAYIQGIIGK